MSILARPFFSLPFPFPPSVHACVIWKNGLVRLGQDTCIRPDCLLLTKFKYSRSHGKVPVPFCLCTVFHFICFLVCSVGRDIGLMNN